jgi:hypothetical protein
MPLSVKRIMGLRHEWRHSAQRFDPNIIRIDSEIKIGSINNHLINPKLEADAVGAENDEKQNVNLYDPKTGKPYKKRLWYGKQPELRYCLD